MIPEIAHVGIGVSNIEKEAAFYRDVMGFKVVLDTPVSGEELSRGVGLSRASIKAKLFKVGSGKTLFEIMEYLSPVGRPRSEELKPCDIGCIHVAFAVKDIDEVYKRLKARGVKFYAPPQTYGEDNPKVTGVKFVYFQDPEGNILEIIQEASND